MNGKNKTKKTAALLLGLAFAFGGVGCSNFIVTDSEKDLNQTVATVNITSQLKDSQNEYNGVAEQVEQIVAKLSTDVSKRDLVAYFLSTGYQYVQNYGYTYENTFNMLMEGLVSREIMIQYAIAYYLKNNSELSAEKCDAYVTAQLAEAKARSEREEALLKANPEVLTLKYFLTDGGKTDEASMKAYNSAVYSLKKSLNSSLDSLEANYITETEEEHDHGEARTTPNGVKTEKEDYVPAKYEIYTGRNVLGDCGSYEKVYGSTTSTRQKAYNAFLANLQGYNMIADDENTSKINELNYYYVELSSILGQSLINKYFEALEGEITAQLNAKASDDPNAKSYVEKKYGEILSSQTDSYSTSTSAFETAMDSVSDTSFLLYGLDGYGYVYNILLPFSKSQEIAYSEAKNNKSNTQNDLYNFRKKLLKSVEGKDLRGSWISEDEHANYSYKKEGDENNYYFFEEDEKYEKLTQYAGNYPYQYQTDSEGAPVKDEDGNLKPKSIGIDAFITTLEEQINLAVGGAKDSGVANKVANWDSLSKYDKDGEATNYKKADGTVDYSMFTYYEGKANLVEDGQSKVLAKDYFNPESKIYKAVSAVNELMFAYSTDTGCLNTYMGYAVSPYGTDFVKEFEWAAQKAVSEGAGSYVVCATDYGWHIVFASFVYDGGEVYGYDAAEADKEGTFSNMFYESVKSSAIENYSTEEQNKVLNRYNNDKSVTLYKSRYQDLLDLDN